MRPRSWAGALVAAVAALCTLASTPALAQDEFCNGDTTGGFPDPDPAAHPLHFGIYPGGRAGQPIGPPAEAVPGSARKTLAALDRLRSDKPFQVHLYLEFTGEPEQRKRVRQALRQARRYGRHGYGVEYVLPYRPADHAGDADVAKFVRFTRKMVRRFGRVPAIEAIQVTNEANNSISPDASDGSYPGARDALVRGVIAAARITKRIGRGDIDVGFNWFYRLDPETETGFWSELGDKGGERLRRATDWVGLDAYPGTYFPPALLPRADSMINAMSVLRECFMPLAGLGKQIPIHVSENGWPTLPPTRSYAEQATALEEMLRAVHTYRANYNVTDYRWFSLRDADSASPNFQQQFGLLRDDYTRKPAFNTYRELIRELG